MCYMLQNVLSAQKKFGEYEPDGKPGKKVIPNVVRIGDADEGLPEQRNFLFVPAENVDTNFPAILIIHATNIDFPRNRVAINGLSLGYLKNNQHAHIFEVDNKKHGRLRKKVNKVTIVSCDRWGDRKSVSNDNIDDIHVRSIDIFYKPKN